MLNVRYFRQLRVAVWSFTRSRPSLVLILGYLSYVLGGWLLLSLPISQLVPIRAIDNLFISVSAVSTTGLITIDPGKSYTFFGQFVVLMLIQLGGVGYMTTGSILTILLGRSLSVDRRRIGRAVFSLPDGFDMNRFVRLVLSYTLGIELVGAILLWGYFQQKGVEGAAWSAIFHSVSAFCTAGFSLFPDSFVGFADNRPVLLIISALSMLGALGFVVIADLARRLFGDGAPLELTSFLVFPVTFGLIGVGTLIFLAFDPTITTLQPGARIVNAFFQAMTASTTVGFNSVNTPDYASVSIVISYLLMLVGASPSGTGGGLKTTTVGVLIAATLSSLRGQNDVRIGGRRIAFHRVMQAMAATVTWVLVLGVAMIALTASQTMRFDVLLFEAISAFATVGLSLGVTAELTDFGKSIIITLMFIGRVGVLGIVLLLISREDETSSSVRDQDVLL